MAIVDEVSAAMKDAMRARDKERTAALRNIRAAFLEAMKADGADTLSDEEAQKVLTRLGKQRRESIAAYTEAGRGELAAAEQAELAVIEHWLPQLADEATTRAWVEEAVAATGATQPGDMGKVMGHLMKHHRGELDGKLANQVVRAVLAGS
jgi:uncharacterized protein YqeY